MSWRRSGVNLKNLPGAGRRLSEFGRIMRAVPCPICRAQIGQRCVTVTGSDASRYHSWRQNAANDKHVGESNE